MIFLPIAFVTINKYIHGKTILDRIIFPFSALSLIIILGSVLSFSTFEGQEQGVGFKFANSINEIIVSDIEEQEQADLSAYINERYRGYEALLGIQSVTSRGAYNILLGNGLGSYVESPFEYKFPEVPVYHLGYVTFFTKSGLSTEHVPHHKSLCIFAPFFSSSAPIAPSKIIMSLFSNLCLIKL